MGGENFWLLPVVLPLTGSFLSLICKERVREILGFLLPFASFVILLIAPFILKLPYKFLYFSLDIITVIFGMVFSLLGALSLLYSIPYLKKERHNEEFYCLSLLLIGALIGVAYSRHLILLYIFWEIVAFATWRLVGFYREKRFVRIADKTFLMTFFGSTFMLLGILWIYLSTGTLFMDELKGNLPQGAFLFVLLGAIAKSATLPLHTWLPDAHPVAPSPMSALLSGIVAKLGILIFIRLFPIFHHTPWKPFLILALFSSLAGGAGALFAQDMKRVIAYSTVSQLGFIFMGLALLTPMGWVGAILFFVAHAIAKGGLFLSAGVIEKATGTRDLEKLGGLIKSMPITAFSFALCSVSIMGFPPLGGFFPKLMVIQGIVKEGYTAVAIGAIISAVLTLLYLARLFLKIFGGKEMYEGIKEKTPLMLFSAFLLGIISLGLGLVFPYLSDYLSSVIGIFGG
ncbi:MAG TPA: NADH-quinone oxidoreductase subunit L [bacterium]|nr:NADH-quinone oxidoreductase subunit L [bacterium]HEX67489.1 NADH-quinone oxidoreductase subunit L [bacterium]